MDQLKVFWKYVVKYHFWILSFLVLTLSWVTFSMSRKALDQQVAERFGTLDNQFTTVSRLESEATTHPNALSDAEMEKILDATKTNVFEAWKAQYERQAPILVWNPKVVNGEAAVRKVAKYPIELHFPFPPPKDDGPLTLTERQVYRDYVQTDFTNLAKIVGARWQGRFEGAVAGSDDDSGEVSTVATDEGTETIYLGPPPIVLWEAAEQSRLQKSMATWWSATRVPSTLNICYTQEDIWILTALLKVISSTNGDVKDNFLAPIKEIIWIKFGKEAAPVIQTAATADGGEDASFTDESEIVESATSTLVDPADDRYVDANLVPLKGADLREKMKSESPEDVFFAVAKRVPVRFKLRMDQAKIPKLLAECGNGAMMIEVKQVRINAGDAPLQPRQIQPSADGSTPIDVGDEGMPFSSEDSGETFDLDSESTYTDDGGGTEPKEDCRVEVFGIVNLFNPPDRQKLGIVDNVSNQTQGNQ